MQPAMNEKKKEEFKSDLTETYGKAQEKVQSTVDKVIRQVKEIRPEEVRQAAVDIGAKVRDTSAQIYDGSTEFAKRNPVRTALGIFAVGFAAGILASIWKKSA